MTKLQIIGLLMPGVAVLYALGMAWLVRRSDPHRRQAKQPKPAER